MVKDGSYGFVVMVIRNDSWDDGGGDVCVGMGGGGGSVGEVEGGRL